jgi:predicted TPR repeat methyltransferase
VLNRTGDAIAVYRQWMEREPDNPTPVHLHAACSRENVPEKCSPAYVEATFDAFADHFDERLHALSYRGPEWIAQLLTRHVPTGGGVLDACCGTGLCGPILRPFAATLTGIDLSQGMLDRAAARNVYDTLEKVEFHAYLRDRSGCFDLLCCADSLIYFGDLRALFAAIAASLRPGGLFLFTIETADGEAGHRLAPSGRYLHGEGYVREALAGSGLETLELFGAPLRTEGGHPVPGLAVAARRG